MNIPVPFIQRQLGHRNIANTMIHPSIADTRADRVVRKTQSDGYIW